MIKLLVLAALAGIGWAVYDSREDVRRYRRIRAM
ncbi:DUF6893 family small protein [Actinomycetospora sp. TBRC 11914]